MDPIQKIATRVEAQLNLPPMIPVESSNVQEFGYDPEERSLYVRFLGKGNAPSSLYVYHDVEAEIYEQFLESDSKGKFIWSHLRDRYEYDKLGE